MNFPWDMQGVRVGSALALSFSGKEGHFTFPSISIKKKSRNNSKGIEQKQRMKFKDYEALLYKIMNLVV